MEENEYRETYQDINTLPCVFERAILVRCADCEQAKRLYLAEREAVACRSVDAHIDCSALQALMHDNARFVLHQSHIDGPTLHVHAAFGDSAAFVAEHCVGCRRAITRNYLETGSTCCVGLNVMKEIQQRSIN